MVCSKELKTVSGSALRAHSTEVSREEALLRALVTPADRKMKANVMRFRNQASHEPWFARS